MPPKASGTRRSARAVRHNSGQDPKSPSSGTGHPTPPTGEPKGSKEKDEDPPKPRRGTKGRSDSHHAEETKPSSRSTKHAPEPSPPDDPTNGEEDDESGITRCVCDEVEAETKDMGFMVQCEQCNVWQHGICMGIDREEDCPEEYFCHDCRPDLHTALLEDLERRAKAPSRRDNKKTNRSTSSQTSRSTSPDGRKSHKSPKRRNTMNSRDPELEIVLDMSRKEAERAGIITDGDQETADGRRKRKRVGDPTDAAESSNTRRKRSAGSPESTRSDAVNVDAPPPRPKSSKHPSNASSVSDPAAGDSGPLGRGRRSSRKEKEPSLDVDASGKSKHPNQYTYRVPKQPVASPSKRAGNAAHEHGTRRNPPQPRPAASPSPVPLSYNIPDHFSHLAPLLPHPTPQGVSVKVGPNEDNRIVEKGVKVRWPPKRTTIGEMRRRVRGMMEYVARAQLEAGERERRADMLRAALQEIPLTVPSTEPTQAPTALPTPAASTEDDSEGAGKDDNGDVAMTDAPLQLKTEEGADPSLSGNDADPQLPAMPTPASPYSAFEVALGQKPNIATSSTRSPTNSAKDECSSIPPKSLGPTTTQLLDELTRELIQFQERFGAGREGKVYRERTDRERRTRGVVEVEMF